MAKRRAALVEGDEVVNFVVYDPDREYDPAPAHVAEIDDPGPPDHDPETQWAYVIGHEWDAESGVVVVRYEVASRPRVALGFRISDPRLHGAARRPYPNKGSSSVASGAPILE